MKNGNYKIDDYSLENIRNLNEIEVIKAIQKVRNRIPDFCNCSICLEDVYAASLNSLPAKYIQTPSVVFKGKTSPEMIEDAVIAAIEKVIKNPTHAK